MKAPLAKAQQTTREILHNMADDEWFAWVMFFQEQLLQDRPFLWDLLCDRVQRYSEQDPLLALGKILDRLKFRLIFVPELEQQSC